MKMEMDFGQALGQLRAGERVCRSGWNGKGMWLALVHASAATLTEEESTVVTSNNLVLPGFETIEMAEWIGMKTAGNQFVPWVCSQSDMLAQDWVIVN